MPEPTHSINTKTMAQERGQACPYPLRADCRQLRRRHWRHNLRWIGSLSGSLTRAGLGLLQSQYYDNFADDTSVQTAINDVDAALITLSRKGASIIADAALLEGRIDLVNSKIENFEDEKDRIRLKNWMPPRLFLKPLM